jgi:gamma-glutamyltranspeptidase
MASSSSHNMHNEMVTISLFEQKLDRSSDVEFGADSSHDLTSNSSHGPNPLMEYRVGRYNAMLRWIHAFMIHRPKVFSALVTFIIFSLPFLISLIVILTLSHPHSSNSAPSTCPTSSSSDVWSTFRVESALGAVATDHPTCSQIGVDLLRKGGNAVDASIAAKLCLGVVSPASSGIGGGALILIHDSASAQNTFIDSRETAPSKATERMFESNPLAAQNGGLAIAVPGEIMGLYVAWERYGSNALDWSDLVAPAAKLAENWIMSEEIAAYAKSASANAYWKEYPALASLFTDSKTGKLKVAGDSVQQPALAAFLNKLASTGPSVFYEDAAEEIATEIQSAGGIVTADDIRQYQPLVYEDEDLIKSTFMGYNYVSISGCSSGGASVAGILNFMESYPEALVSVGRKLSLCYRCLIIVANGCCLQRSTFIV